MDPKDYLSLLVKSGKALKRVRDEELRSAPHPSVAIEALEGPFQHALACQPPAPSSGLVEFQLLMAKLRNL